MTSYLQSSSAAYPARKIVNSQKLSVSEALVFMGTFLHSFNNAHAIGHTICGSMISLQETAKHVHVLVFA